MSSSGEKPEFKLIYFDLRGRAEASRAMMIMSGVPFADVRIVFKDWRAFKPGGYCFTKCFVCKVYETFCSFLFDICKP